jgi:ribonucleotide monophosphatase NagD (HAD superfamily)
VVACLTFICETTCTDNSTHSRAKLQAFDIDGVLIRGKEEIPGATQVLQKLTALHVPFVFVTNGGGCTEAHKAAELSVRFSIEVKIAPQALNPCLSLLPSMAINVQLLVCGRRHV